MPTATTPSRLKATRRMSAVSQAWNAYQPVTSTASTRIGMVAPVRPNTYCTASGKLIPQRPLG